MDGGTTDPRGGTASGTRPPSVGAKAEREAAGGGWAFPGIGRRGVSWALTELERIAQPKRKIGFAETAVRLPEVRF